VANEAMSSTFRHKVYSNVLVHGAAKLSFALTHERPGVRCDEVKIPTLSSQDARRLRAGTFGIPYFKSLLKLDRTRG
jgi:hypothetical protein